MFRREAAGELDAAAATAGEAVEIAERFGDADLFALAAQSWIYEFEDGELTRGRVYADTAVLRDAVTGA
jgi:hypothetical protein